MTGPWEAVLEIQEVHYQRKKMSTADHLGGRAGDPGASNINAKKHQQQTP
jgi:hypothetical protein